MSNITQESWFSLVVKSTRWVRDSVEGPLLSEGGRELSWNLMFTTNWNLSWFICFHWAVTFAYFFSLQAWTRLNSCRAMRIKRFIKRPLIWLSTTLEQRMKTAALPHRWISTSNSTSSISVRLPWKASSSEVPLCCVPLYLANPVVEPQATHGVILSMFSITLFALIRLPCAHALTYVWKTFGSPWQDAPYLARGCQNHPSPLDSEPLHCHLRGAEAPFYTLRYSLLLLQEYNPSFTSPHTPGIQAKAAFLVYLLQCVPAVQGDIQTFWERSWSNCPYSSLDASLDGCVRCIRSSHAMYLLAVMCQLGLLAYRTCYKQWRKFSIPCNNRLQWTCFLVLKNTEHIWPHPFSTLSSQAGLQTTVEICIPSQPFLSIHKKRACE